MDALKHPFKSNLSSTWYKYYFPSHGPEIWSNNTSFNPSNSFFVPILCVCVAFLCVCESLWTISTWTTLFTLLSNWNSSYILQVNGIVWTMCQISDSKFENIKPHCENWSNRNGGASTTLTHTTQQRKINSWTHFHFSGQLECILSQLPLLHVTHTYIQYRNMIEVALKHRWKSLFWN